MNWPIFLALIAQIEAFSISDGTPASKPVATEYITVCNGAPLDSRCIISALSKDGAVTLSGVLPAAMRKQALCATARCAAAVEFQTLSGKSSLRSVSLPDGTLRVTSATRTAEGVPMPMAVDGCAQLDEATAPLRALVDQASRKFVGALESLLSGPAMRGLEGKLYPSLAEVRELLFTVG
eukprot:6197831-Pleurochrysis_carterae.AAC.1